MSFPGFLKYFIQRKRQRNRAVRRVAPDQNLACLQPCLHHPCPCHPALRQPRPQRPRPLAAPTGYLAHSGLLLSQAHDEDAVGLPDAALGPRCERAVRLVEHDAVDVLLLPQPAGQPVLVDTGRHGHGAVQRPGHVWTWGCTVAGVADARDTNTRGRGGCRCQAVFGPAASKKLGSARLFSTRRLVYLSRAAEPRRCLMLSLVSSRTGPENTHINYRKLSWQPTSPQMRAPTPSLEVWSS